MTRAAIAFFFAGSLLTAGPLQTTTVKLLNAGNPVVADSHHDDVGLYTLVINGKNVAALCIDFADESVIGSSWTANISQVGGDISDTYHPHSPVVYKEEAYLFSLLAAPGVSNTKRIEVQHAAWSLTGYPYTLNSDEKQYVSDAQNGYKNLSFANYEVVTATTDCGRQQEFLIDPAAVAPEPASYALFGLGLGVAGLIRKRSKRS